MNPEQAARSSNDPTEPERTRARLSSDALGPARPIPSTPVAGPPSVAPDSRSPASRSRRAPNAGESLVDWVSGLVVSSALAALCLVIADRIFRPEWDFLWREHWVGSILLYAAVAAWLGLAWGLVVCIELYATSPFRRRVRRRRLARVLFHAVVVGVCAWPTAAWTFSGKRISQTIFGVVGPPVFLLVLMTAVAAFVWFVIAVERRCARGNRRLAVIAGLVLVASAAAPVWVDMTQYVSLYGQLHAVLEFVAFALLFTGMQLLGFAATRTWPRLIPVTRGIALVLVAYGIAFVSSTRLRAKVDSLLAHAWVDEVYVGRNLRRTQLVEAAFDLAGDGSLEMLRVRRLKERYGIADDALHPIWDRPSPEPSAAAQSLREGQVRNVLVYYVDTLRADAASDPTVMPLLQEYRKKTLDFRRAYSPGSDTLRSLPALTGGNYFVRQNHANDLTDIARRAPHESVLVIPESAGEFLHKLRPAFSFERTIRVPDATEGREVWGYGADRPTAGRVVDEALTYLRGRGSDSPFFLWLFNFDQHNWRELDKEFVDERAETLKVPDEAPLNWRYRVVARNIDQEFHRLVEGLDELGLSEDTVVVFVSDHGEGLGRGGFWVHSVFLWDALLRVPLLIRAPGVEPRVVNDVVSLVDVAPTVSPYLSGVVDHRGYHGVDLLEYAVGKRPERLHPLVLQAASQDRLTRIGMIDPERELKLVVRVEAALPELYDLAAEDPDADNMARQRPEITRELLKNVATSPVFPRAHSDFDFLLDLGTRQF